MDKLFIILSLSKLTVELCFYFLVFTLLLFLFPLLLLVKVGIYFFLWAS